MHAQMWNIIHLWSVPDGRVLKRHQGTIQGKRLLTLIFKTQTRTMAWSFSTNALLTQDSFPQVGLRKIWIIFLSKLTQNWKTLSDKLKLNQRLKLKNQCGSYPHSKTYQTIKWIRIIIIGIRLLKWPRKMKKTAPLRFKLKMKKS